MPHTARESSDVTVYGATGYTGGLVSESLAGRGIDFAVAGRDADRLHTLARRVDDASGTEPLVRCASVDDREALNELVDGTEVLINCAGPFVDVGRPVALAAVRRGVDYVDIAGEQTFLRWVERELAPVAAERGISLLPGCAFEFAAGSLAGRSAVDQGARRVVLAYWFEQTWTSPGTKKSILRNLAEPGWAWEEGREVRCPPAGDVFDVPWPEGGPRKAVQRAGGASLMLPKMGEIASAKSAFVVDSKTARLLSALSPALPRLAAALTPAVDVGLDLYRKHVAEQRAPDRAAPFRVVAFDPVSGELFARLEGCDPYTVTARMAVESAERLLREDVGAGYLTPGAVWNPHEFAEAVGAELHEPR